MSKTGRMMTAAALALAMGLGGGAALAQQPPAPPRGEQDDGANRPEGGGQVPSPVPRGAAPGMPGMPGMMGQGGGMPGMMGGGMGPMMGMMHGMMGGHHGAMPGMMGGHHGAMRSLRRIEGQLAFLRAELRLTEAQMPPWNAFADAVRAAVERLRQARTEAMQAARQPATAPQLLERRIALLSAQLEAARGVAAAMGPLYAALSEEQKRTADELMTEHMRHMRMHGP